MVVCDFSCAILIAIARAFSDCADLRNYMQTCYDIAVLKKDVKAPRCYIRLDVSHLIATVARWNCLKGKPRKVRQYFLRCIAYAYKIDSFTQLQIFLESVLVVSMSEEIGCHQANDLQSEICLRYTNNAIKGIAMDDKIKNENDDLQEDEIDDNENDINDSDN